MKYTSPQIVNHSRATEAIQSIGRPDNLKPLGQTFDSPDPNPLTTPAAYEADE